MQKQRERVRRQRGEAALKSNEVMADRQSFAPSEVGRCVCLVLIPALLVQSASHSAPFASYTEEQSAAPWALDVALEATGTSLQLRHTPPGHVDCTGCPAGLPRLRMQRGAFTTQHGGLGCPACRSRSCRGTPGRC